MSSWRSGLGPAGAASIGARLTEIEADLYQIKNQNPKDKGAHPIRLNDRLAGLLALAQTGDGAPTAAHRVVAAELLAELQRHQVRLDDIQAREIGPLDEQLLAAGAKPVMIRYARKPSGAARAGCQGFSDPAERLQPRSIVIASTTA